MLKCPLCLSSRRTEQDSVCLDKLAEAYQRQLQIHVHFPQNLDYLTLWRCDNCDLQYFDPMTIADESFYESLQRFDWYYLDDKDEYTTAALHVRANDNVLEIGAGRASFARKITRANYLGLELSGKAIRMAATLGIKLVGESIEAHSLTHANQYDVVCSFQVLEHVSDVRSFIHASIACLKSGGKLIYSVPNDDGLPGVEFNNILNMPPHHVTRWTKACMRNVAREFDLQIVAVEEEQVSDIHLAALSRTMAQHAIGTFLGWAPRLLDERYVKQPLRSLVNAAARPLRSALRDRRLRPTGHSLTCIFQK